MNVLDAIRRKRAVRQYRDEPLPDEVVRQIVNAGRRAQSSKNGQPWRFIVVRNKETLQALARLGDYASHVPGAAMAVVIVTPDPSSTYAIMFDTGQAAAYMQLAALELGVGSCMVSLHRPEGAREILGYPNDMHVRFLISFGYPADPAALEPASRPGGRQSMSDIVFFERWGETGL